MKITAHIRNSEGAHDVTLQTDDRQHSLAIKPRPSGFGSRTNGGELLLLALATCYCNDIYREAAKRKITVVSVEVSVGGDFGTAGEPATNVTYSAKVHAQAPEEAIRDLMKHTDTVAEIQNSLRAEIPVRLERIEAFSV